MAMQGRGNVISILMLLVALLKATEAKNHNVGATLGWDYPAANDPGYYDTWASKQTFLPGDTLTFTYIPTQHDTTVVTEAEYTSCGMSTGKKYTSGTDVVTLEKAGTYYFYCSIFGHCDMGMKMKVTVGAAAAPALAPTAAPVTAPALAPVKAPTLAPTLAPVKAPTLAPVKAPATVAPVPIPVPVPVTSPAPASAPSQSGAVAVGLYRQVLAAATAAFFVAVFMF